MANWKKIYSNTGKVTAALIDLGFINFKLSKGDECIEIDILSLITSPYRYINVYDNIVTYKGDPDYYFEGMAYRKKTIIMDILNK